MKDWSVIGKSVLKPDALKKVTGRAKYCADVELPRMLYAKVPGSKYPHAGMPAPPALANAIYDAVGGED